jgi:hypothetical protein
MMNSIKKIFGKTFQLKATYGLDKEILKAQNQDAAGIAELEDRMLIQIMADPYILPFLTMDDNVGHELIDCIFSLRLEIMIDMKISDVKHTKLAIEEFKRIMQIPLEDVPLHVNDHFPINKVIKWRLKNAL